MKVRGRAAIAARMLYSVGLYVRQSPHKDGFDAANKPAYIYEIYEKVIGGRTRAVARVEGTDRLFKYAEQNRGIF